MKFLKKTLKALMCASLVLSLGISATACSTDDPGSTDGPGEDDPGYIEKPFTPPDDGSEGIDWTKYWDGSTTGSTTDNFKFTGSKDIGTLTGDYTPTVTPATEGESVIVTFSDGVAAQAIEYGGLAVKPNAPEINGKMFVGWYSDSGLTTAYDFSEPVKKSNLSLYAKWADLPNNIERVVGNHESITAEFQGSAETTVQYAKYGTNDWITVDKELVRSTGSNESRVDILGLAAGEYKVKIGSADIVEPVTVDAYDRSGYAHFNRQQNEKAYNGVGAYNDDGTLKEGALVIYINEQNKNNVKDYVYKNVNGTLVKEDITQYIKPGKPTQNDKPLGGDSYWSIGYILNNRGYTNNNERESYGIQKLSHVYGAVAVRFLGTVTSTLNSDKCSPTLTGLTYFAKSGQTNPITGETYKKGVAVPNGGTVNDNGQMARITNAYNLTVEGVGDDAGFDGWGVHFVSNDNLHKFEGSGTSFEVRNLTFINYPEDAVGMEGTQGSKVDSTGSITSGASSADADLISPVERCWVHHNTFLPGYCANPAESDKSEGDGSCDFKRGQYYTCSYNYFEWCHKTNLIGSSDSSLQFNISMHHNMWYNCGSRIPLLRRSNVHFYNNYVCGDQTAASPYSHISKASLSYVHSLRADSYMFSEANYYEGSKQITDGKSGGNAKSYKDVITQCFGTNTMVETATRDQSVSNNCAFSYRNINYSSFDTNPSQFYYDSTNKKTDALVDDAVAARTRVLYEAGALGYEPPISQQKTKTTPQSPSSFKLPSNKPKGEIAVFALAGTTEVTITAGSKATGDLAPDLCDNYGKVWLAGFTGTKTVILPKGTYILLTGQKDKESEITAVTFVEGEGNSEARVEAAKVALAAIPSIITISSENIINEALAAYSALVGDEVNQIDAELKDRYAKASAAYEELLVEYVIARINYIGTVTADSYVRINAAQTSYNKLSADKQAKVTNKSTLDAAWSAFASYEVENVVNRLNDLPDLTADGVNIKSSETVEKLYDWFNAVQDAYNDLNDDGDDKRDQVPEVSLKKLTDGLAELKNVESFLTFKETLAGASVEDATSVGGNIVSLYNKLSEAQRAKLTAEEQAKFEEIKTAYEAFASQAVTSLFLDGKPSADIFKHTGTKQNPKGSSLVVHAYSETAIATGAKLEASTELTLTLATKMTVSLYLLNSNAISVDGKSVSVTQVNGDNVVTVTLEAGAHTIKRGGSENSLYYAVLTPTV